MYAWRIPELTGNEVEPDFFVIDTELFKGMIFTICRWHDLGAGLPGQVNDIPEVPAYDRLLHGGA